MKFEDQSLGVVSVSLCCIVSNHRNLKDTVTVGGGSADLWGWQIQARFSWAALLHAVGLAGSGLRPG